MKIELITKAKQTKLFIPKDNVTAWGGYYVSMNSDEVKELYETLKALTDKPIKYDDRPYHDDISTYVGEVERILTVSGYKGKLNLSIICYTDKDDDNWIGLSPQRIAKLAGMIYPYI